MDDGEDNCKGDEDVVQSRFCRQTEGSRWTLRGWDRSDIYIHEQECQTPNDQEHYEVSTQTSNSKKT